MSRARDTGTRWETIIVDYLRARGWNHAERRAFDGHGDRGDITGVPLVCIEAKNVGRITLAAWLDELTIETANDHAEIGAVWIKRRGRVSAANGYVVMDGQTFTDLLIKAGYGTRRITTLNPL